MSWYVTKTQNDSKMQLKHLYQRTNISKNISTIYRQGGILMREGVVQSTQQRRS